MRSMAARQAIGFLLAALLPSLATAQPKQQQQEPSQGTTAGGGDPYLIEEQEQLILQQQQQTQNQQQQAQNQQDTFDPCIPCDGPIDQSLSFDGTSCNEWLRYAVQVPANTEECALERVLGWKFCGCPAPGVTKKCDFCNDKASIQKEKTLPFSSITCEAFADIPALDGDATCQLTDDFASYCGCSTSIPQCTLCDDGAPPQNLNAPLYLGMTCSDIHDLYLVSSTLRCGEVAADYPFDLKAYCGCNNAVKPNHGCGFCPYGGTLNEYTKRLASDETSTCGDWATLAEYANEGESSCAVFQYVGLECCDGMQLPDFFTNYFDEEDAAGTSGTTPASDPTRVNSSTSQQATGGNAAQTGTTDGTTPTLNLADGPDLEGTTAVVTRNPVAPNVPFVLDISTAGNINEAVRMCFKEHTTPLVAVNTLQLGAESPDNANATSSLQQGELGDLFQPARVSRNPMNLSETGTQQASNPTNKNVEDAIKAGEKVQSKWKQLYQELDHVALPEAFGEKIPGEYATNTFLPGLSGCLESAINKFTTCYLCENGQRPLQSEKMISIVGLYCDEYDEWRAEATAEDCKSFDTSWLPFDMASFCGCPGVPDLAVFSVPEGDTATASRQDKCSFCPEGQVLILEPWKHDIKDKALLQAGGYVVGSTCAEWSQMADYVTTPEACSFVQTIAVSGCCEFIGESILDKTTPSPTPNNNAPSVLSPTTAPTTQLSANETVSPVAAPTASNGAVMQSAFAIAVSILSLVLS